MSLVVHENSKTTGILPTIAAAIGITLLTWPIIEPGVEGGVDSNWQAGIHMAAQRGLHFGTEIVFTYGPLGFLAGPRLFYSDTGTLAVLYTVLVHAAMVGIVFHLAARRLGYLWAAVLAFSLASVALVEAAELVPIVFFLGAAAALGPGRSDRKVIVTVTAASFLSAFQFVIKFNTGVVVFLMGTVLALALRGRKRLITLASHTTIFLGAVFLLWIGTDQPTKGIVSYVGRSLDLAVGHASAMGLDPRGAGLRYLAAMLVVGALAWLVYVHAPWRGTDHPFVLLALLLLLSAAVVKHSFMRNDNAHASIFFLMSALLPLAILLLSKVGRRLLVTWIALIILVAPMLSSQVQGWVGRPLLSFGQLKTLALPADRRAFVEEQREAWVRLLGLDGTSLSLLSGETSHIDQLITQLAWAYELDWRPAPVFMPFTAYTTDLDQLNARALLAREGPSRIVRGLPSSIDRRVPMFESPQYIKEMMCGFRELHASRQWEVLGRTNYRCGPARFLASHSGSGSISVPVAGPNEMIIARFELGQSRRRKVLGILLKPFPPAAIQLRYGLRSEGHRFLEGTAGGPHVLCVPRAAGFSPRFVETRCPISLRMYNVRAKRVSFYSVPIAP